MMAKGPEPVVLELASLPREQMGPFLLLGLDKAAEKARVEENRADRVKWARRNLIKTPLEDINWARDALADTERRVKADAASLNVDTADAYLAELARSYGLEGGQAARTWQPLDSEKPLADYIPPAEVPDPAAVREALVVPPLPEEVPGAGAELARRGPGGPGRRGPRAAGVARPRPPPPPGPRPRGDNPRPAPAGEAPRPARDNQPLGSPTIYRLCEEVISLRERNNRQHQEFER